MVVLICVVILMLLAGAISVLAPIVGTPDMPGPRTAMSVGLLMLAAWLVGILFDRIRLPRVSGYLVTGLLLGPAVLKLIPQTQVDTHLRFAGDLAIALIALTAGGEIDLKWLRKQIVRLSIIAGVEVLIVWAVVGAAAYGALSIVGGDALGQSTLIVLSALVGLVAASNSPAVVIAMITEHRAAGPFTRTALSVTIVKDMAMVVLFAAMLAVGKGVVDEQTAISGRFLLAVGVQLGGSLVVGGVFGALMAWYVQSVNRHLPIFLVGSCLLIALLGERTFTVVGEKAHLEPLLTALAAGLVMRNLWPVRSEPFFHVVEAMSLPIYCLFFAVIGAKLNLSALVGGALWVAGMVVVRSAAVWAGIGAGLKLAGSEVERPGKLWLAFVPQAGVALALILLIENKLDVPGADLAVNLLVGMVAVHLLVGPIGFRWALVASDEAGRMGDEQTDQAPEQPSGTPSA